MKQYTYKDFQRGQIAMFNNNVDSVIAVIEKAFPNSTHKAAGGHDFYFVENNDWCSTTSFLSKTTIAASEILLEDETDFCPHKIGSPNGSIKINVSDCRCTNDEKGPAISLTKRTRSHKNGLCRIH